MRKHTAFGGVFDNYLKANMVAILVFSAFLVLGVCTGSVYAVSFSTSQALSESVGSISAIKNGYDANAVFRSALFSHLQIAFFIWLCGLTRLGIFLAPVILFLKGFTCGFCTSALIIIYEAPGILAVGLGILPQMLFVFVLMESLCIASVKQTRFMTKVYEKGERRRRFVSYCLFCSFVFVLFLGCALFEGFVSPYILAWTLKL